MKKQIVFLLSIFILSGLSACKSKFETLRTEGSAEERLSKAKEYLASEECDKAQLLFESVIGAFRGMEQQEDIYYNYAKSHYCQENYLTAAHYFNNFASTYPNSDKREEADYLVAYAYYQLSPSYKLEQTYTLKAIDQFQLFTNTHPNSGRVADANKLIDELRKKLETKAYTEGKLYYDLKEYEAATVSFKNLLKEFPESPNTEKVRYLIALSSYEWAENSILAKQEERYRLTSESANTFLNRHKSSEYTKKVKSILKDANQKIKEFKK